MLGANAYVVRPGILVVKLEVDKPSSVRFAAPNVSDPWGISHSKAVSRALAKTGSYVSIDCNVHSQFLLSSRLALKAAKS